MGKTIVFAFSISMAGCLLANWLFHTSQLPEGPLPYWVAGAVWCLVLLRKGEGWLDSLVNLVQAQGGGRKNYASEYTFKAEGRDNG